MPGARVALGPSAAFERVGALTAPRIEHRKRYHLGFGGDDDLEGATAVAPGGGAPRGVEVLRSQGLGPLRVVTLRSRSSAALAGWLRDNDFQLPEGLAAGTQVYLDDGWDLVIARVRPEEAGVPLVELQPLAIRFRTPRPVYPLRLSRLAEGGSSARIDLLAPWKADVQGFVAVAEESPERPPARGAALVYAGRMSGADVDPSLALPGGYLTSFRFTIDPRSPDRDPAFTRAADARPYRQVRVVYEDVQLGGILLPVVIVVAAAGGLAWWLRRRVARGRVT